MKFTHLGRTGLEVSRLCLGTMNFGWKTEEKNAYQIMDMAHDNGINFFDTADIYFWGENKGRVEEIIGNWFSQGGGRRERTVLATKLYEPMGDWPNNGKLSALHFRRALDSSLKRLKTDYIDLYQFHHIDRNTPWDELWQAVEVAIQQGKIIYTGSSNFAGWNIATAESEAAKRNMLGLVSEQSIYNLITRLPELEVIPAVEYYGLAFLPWSPLEGGLLGGVLKKERQSKRRLEGRAAQTLEKYKDNIARYEEFCDELGHEPALVALSWLLHQKVVTAPIIGPRTESQLIDIINVFDIKLKEDELRTLSNIFPGYKPAPEEYAW